MEIRNPASPSRILLIDADSDRQMHIRNLFAGRAGMQLQVARGVDEIRHQQGKGGVDLAILHTRMIPELTADGVIDVLNFASPIVILVPSAISVAGQRATYPNSATVLGDDCQSLDRLPWIGERLLRPRALPGIVDEEWPSGRLSPTACGAWVEATSTLVIVHDRHGVVLDWECGSTVLEFNEAIRLTGRPLEEFLDSASVSGVRDCLEAVLTDGVVRSVRYAIPTRAEVRIFTATVVPHGAGQLLAILQDVTDRERATTAIARLSPREKQVLDFIIAGETNKVIGAHMAIGVKTVETHRSNLMKKLQARTLAEVLRLAFTAESR